MLFIDTVKRLVKSKAPSIRLASPDRYSKLRVLSYLVLGLCAGALGGAGFFVYDRVYRAIGDAQAILLLRSEISTEAVDFDRLDRVSRAWDLKHATTTIQIARDPFMPVATSTKVKK